MNRLSKTILTLLLVLTLMFPYMPTSALATETKSDVHTEMADLTFKRFNDNQYYQFTSPSNIFVDDEYLVVTESRKGAEKGSVLLFLNDGSLLITEIPFINPKKAIIYDDFLFVLDEKQLFACDVGTIRTYLSHNPYDGPTLRKMFSTVISATDVLDFSINSNFLYLLTDNYDETVLRYNLYTRSAANPKLPLLAVDGLITAAYSLDYVTYIDSFSINGKQHIVLNTLSKSDQYVVMEIEVDPETPFNADEQTAYLEIPLLEQTVLGLATAGGNVFISSPQGVYAAELKSGATFSREIQVVNKTPTNEELRSPAGLFAFQAADGITLYVTDNLRSRSIKRFAYADGILSFDDFCICSMSAAPGSFSTPVDMVSVNGTLYVADAENSRIQIVSAKGVVSVLPLPAKPTAVNADSEGYIYVTTENNRILRYTPSLELSDEYTSASSKAFYQVIDIAISTTDDSVYVLDAGNDRVVLFDRTSNTFETDLVLANASKIWVDVKSGNVLALAGTTVLNTADAKRPIIARGDDHTTYTDLYGDFNGNLFLVGEKDGKTSITRFVKQADETHLNDLIIHLEENFLFTEIAVDTLKQNVYFLSEEGHCLFVSKNADYRSLFGITNYTDIIIPTALYNKTENPDVRVASLKETSNCTIYPLNEADNLYPTGYAYTEYTVIPKDALVIVAGYTDDGRYAYVLYRDFAGFMDADGLETDKQNEAVPYTYGNVLHNNTAVYKYPTKRKDYQVGVLEKSASIVILDRAMDFTCLEGFLWYRISYTAGNTTHYAYIMRFNAVEDEAKENPDPVLAKINAKLFSGSVEVFADRGETSLGVYLADKTKVEILEQSEDDEWIYVRQVVPAGAEAIEGYILKTQVNTSHQSNAFIVGMIILGVALVAAFSVIIIRIFFHKPQQIRRTGRR